MPFVVNALTDVEANDPDWFYKLATTHSYRVHKMSKLRMEPTKRATPPYVVRELLYHLTVENNDMSDVIFIVTLEIGLLGASQMVRTPLPGRRGMRLRYAWSEVEPYLWLKPRELSDVVLTKMAQPGGIFRAQVRHAASMTEAMHGKNR